MLVVASACATNPSDSSATAPGESALSTAYAAWSQSSGTLLCDPSDAQTALCSGLAAGDACTLSSTDGTKTWSGTCRASVDGTAVACVPNPKAPPAELVEACSGKAAGDACQADEAFGKVREGACVAAKDGTTLICGRVHTPSQARVDACEGKAAGDACDLASNSDKATAKGVCSLGPASTGTLACSRAQELIPPWEKACEGLEAGAACSIGKSKASVAGACAVPAAGGAAVCVVPCADLKGSFECGHKGGGRDGDGEGGQGHGDKDGGAGAPHPGCDRDGGHDPFPGADGGEPTPGDRDGGSRPVRDGGARPVRDAGSPPVEVDGGSLPEVDGGSENAEP